MVFGIRLSIGTVGEQADNLEATARAYQDRHEHCKLSHEQHATLPASVAVITVTDLLFGTPSFFGQPAKCEVAHTHSPDFISNKIRQKPEGGHTC
jgi:hypothetical protein